MNKNILQGILLSTLVFTASSRVEAEDHQPIIQLDKLVEEVINGNPELKFYEEEIKAAKGDSQTAGAWINPELGASIGRKEVQNQGGGLEGEGTAWSVSVTQTFEYPGRIGLRKSIANGELRLAKLGLKRFKTALKAKARLLGFELLGKQELANAARKVSARAQDLISVLVQREPAGVAPLLETRIIQASLLSLRRDALEAEKEAQSALFALNQLRGKNLSALVFIAPTDIKLPILPKVEELIGAAATNNIDLQMQKVELEKQGFKVALSKNERWPSIAVGPFYSEESASENEKTVGVSLSLPIPAWNQNSGNIDSSRAREEQAKTSLILIQRKIEQEVREKTLAYELLLSEMSKWSPQISSELQEAATLGDKHYRLGAIPVATYIELQERYLSGLKAINQTRTEALETVQNIEFLTGQTFLQIQTLGSKKKEEKK